MIQKVGRHWVLFSTGGKVIGKHRTKREAVSQERAIQIAKARRAGHRIPRPSRKR